MQAMILAAGFGTRLLPYTAQRPKPLFPLLNQPLLLLTIQRLRNAGFDHIVVNCHHLRDQISTALQGVTGVVVLEEEVLLGTGGGLRGALSFLRDEPLLVTNGDIYHTVEFAGLYAEHLNSGARVSLAVHDCPRFNNVRVMGQRIVGFGNTCEKSCLAFTGLHVLEPEILHDIAPGQFSCVLDCYRKMLNGGEEIAALRIDGSYWTDMGTPEDYLHLHGGLLKGSIPCWSEIIRSGTSSFVVAPGANVAEGVIMEDWVCLGEVEIESDVTLSRVVVWDNVRVSAGSRVADTLIAS